MNGKPSFPFCLTDIGAIAKRLCNGLQIRLAQFDSGSRLQIFLHEMNNLAHLQWAFLFLNFPHPRTNFCIKSAAEVASYLRMSFTR